MNETAPSFHGLLESKEFSGKDARDFLETIPIGVNVEITDSSQRGVANQYAGSLRERNITADFVELKIENGYGKTITIGGPCKDTKIYLRTFSLGHHDVIFSVGSTTVRINKTWH